jgi:hypothetical protein
MNILSDICSKLIFLNTASTRLSDPETQEFKVAPFDAKALDMFKLVAMQSKKVMNAHNLLLSGEP